MRAFYCLIISSLLLLQGAMADPVTPTSQTNSDLETRALNNSEVEAYLNAITVEDFNIHRAELDATLQHLDEVVSLYGLQILFRSKTEDEQKVSLKTRNLSLSKNLSFLCQQLGYDWWVEEGVIIVGAPGSNEALVTEFIPLNSSKSRRLVQIQSVR